MRPLVALLLALHVATPVAAAPDAVSPVAAAPAAAVRAPAAVPARASAAIAGLPAPEPCVGCWRPRPGTSWQWQLLAPPGRDRLVDVGMYDVDGFDAGRGLVARMRARGIRSVCYVSAGAWEDWRPDAGDFPDEVLGRRNGWAGERWLDVRRLDVLGPILEDRVAMCARKGFDGIEFDNVDGYANRSGFALTARDQLTFNVWLANTAHAHGLAAFLKNDLDQIRKLLPYFDGAVNEQCHQYDECGRLRPFVDAGKPVFGVEYRLAPSAFCDEANRRDFDFLRKRPKLDAWRVACRGA